MSAITKNDFEEISKQRFIIPDINKNKAHANLFSSSNLFIESPKNSDIKLINETQKGGIKSSYMG